MQLIPIQPIANQTFQVQLAGQACVLNVYQLQYGLFVDLYVSNSLIVPGVIAENRNRIVRSAYLGFIGDICFFDTQGSNDPQFDGLGTRYQLVYLTADDLAGGA
jgi:hypothetical protein